MKLLLSALIALLSLAAPGFARGPAPGDRAPGFTLNALDNRRVNLANYRGHVVVLGFWATWNGPSAGVVTALKKAHETFGRQGAVVIGVSIDTKSPDAVRAFVRQNGMGYTVVQDSERRVMSDYAISTIPMTFIIDKAGVVRYVDLGYQPDSAATICNHVRALM